MIRNTIEVTKGILTIIVMSIATLGWLFLFIDIAKISL